MPTTVLPPFPLLTPPTSLQAPLIHFSKRVRPPLLIKDEQGILSRRECAPQKPAHEPGIDPGRLPPTTGGDGGVAFISFLPPSSCLNCLL